MNLPQQFYLIFFLFLILVAVRQRLPKRVIKLESPKFWKLVLSQEKPVVFLVTKGYFIQRMHYVVIYQGVFFCSEAHKIEAPEGIIPIGTDANFF